MIAEERRLHAKIPGAETGIEIKTTLCDICTPGMQCGIDAYVKDGVIIKVEGSDGHCTNHGKLCTKGLASRQYIYREDRIRTPLRRVGQRGDGRFEPISWDEAYREIAEKLDVVKSKYGADSVAFYSGYPKWHRALLRRFAHAFGSCNYGTESSACFTATIMSWLLSVGSEKVNPDLGRAGLFMGWCSNPYHSSYLMAGNLQKQMERGLKSIIIDTRRTPTSDNLCDLFVQIRPGTDGALAHGIAALLISRGWYDHDFVRAHVYGFEEYAAYVSEFTPEIVRDITGVSEDILFKIVDMIHEHGPVATNESGASLVHHINGMQNHRAVMALTAILGTFDAPGGNIPVELDFIHTPLGINTLEHEFMTSTMPADHKPFVGAERFPLWAEVIGEMQSCDMARQILEGRPYPLRAVFAHGMNFRMFNASNQMRDALCDLDFFVDIDLFMTDSAKLADIVLPACTSFERSEFKGYPGGFLFYTNPVIPPLHSSKPDTDILTELANVMELPDPLLRSGYRACVEYMLSGNGIDLDELKKSPYPLRHEASRPVKAGEWKYKTPTGKFELKSTILEKYPHLDALPTWRPVLDDADAGEYPMVLSAGARLPTVLHSRLHNVPWLRSQRPEPTADINLGDAEKLQISENDLIDICTSQGFITVRAAPGITVAPGCVHMYHSYPEADVNSIIPPEHNDPYSGFPGYLSVRCRIRRTQEEGK